MKEGEIPWIENQAFEPHYFSFLDPDEETEVKGMETENQEREETLPLNLELIDPL